MLLYHGMLYLAKHVLVYHAAIPWYAIFSQACFSLPLFYTILYLARHTLVYHAAMLLCHRMLHLAKHALVCHDAIPRHATFSQACFSLPCCYAAMP